MISIPKTVTTNTLEQLDWNNSHRIEGDLAEQVAKLKDEVPGSLLVYGSATLMGALVENDLVDEYRLMVFPTLLGSGKRLFADGTPKSLRLVDSRPVGNDGVVILTYEPIRKG